MKTIRIRTPDGAIHTMPRDMKLKEAIEKLRTKGIQLTGKQLADGLFLARSIH